MKQLNQDIDEFFANPDKEIIDCEIESPQFRNGKVYKMQKQYGTFIKSELKFVHSGAIGHDICFKNIEEFEKACLSISKIK